MMPTAFISHGGGPWPVIDLPFGSPEETRAMAAFMASIAKIPVKTPEAVIVI